MTLVSSTPLLTHARKNGYCVAAFNVHTLEMLQAVVEAAAETESPVILQSTVGTVNHLGPQFIASAAQTASDLYRVPIALHLDHCTDLSTIVRCIRAGYTSVMIDASHSSFEDNVAITKQVVELANAVGINVEAELGRVGGVEDEIVVGEEDATLADPDECKLFVELTGVHTLAPAIGTAHGIYKGEPRIAFDRIKRIAQLVSIPLVLHGGSGIPDEQVKRCVSLGMSKMNIATELRIAFSNAIKEVFNKNPDENDPRKYMVPAKNALRQMAIDKMILVGAAGKAPLIR